MTEANESWGRVREVFDEALQFPPERREAFLDEACAGDPELRREVDELLHHHERSGEFLDHPPLTLPVEETGFEELTEPRRLGDLRLIGFIDRGGIGIVYLAFDEAERRLVAVKQLLRSKLASQRDVARLQREGEIGRALDHPGIVPVYATGVEDGVPYLVMEYVPGLSLAQEFAARREGRGRGDVTARRLQPEHASFPETAARIVLGVAEALAHAHAAGVIHRDVTPGNVMLDGELRPRLVDFGVAEVAGGTRLTLTGEIQGTLNYMSPEQARLIDDPVDHRTDVYALGAVLYEFLTGRPPVEYASPFELPGDVFRRSVAGVRELNPEVPGDLASVCHKAIEILPDERYATMEAMAEDLRRFLGHVAVHATPPSAVRRARRWLRGHRRLVASVAAAALLVFGALAGGVVWAESAERDRLRESLVERLEEVLAEPGDPDPDQCTLLLGELAGHRRRYGDTGPRLDELGARLEQVVGIAIQAGELRVLEGLIRSRIHGRPKERAIDEIWTGNEEALISVVANAARVAAYEGGSPEKVLERVMRQFGAKLLLDVRPADVAAGAQVYAHRIDPLNGKLDQPRDLGTVPIGPLTLAPGHYRFVVDQPGYGSAEVTRWIRNHGAEYEVTAWLRADQKTLAGMRRVEGSESFGLDMNVFVHGEAGAPEQYDELSIPHRVPAFWIDPVPVTNAQYQVYLDETGATRPAFWQDSGRPDNWPDRPVTQISLDEARRCAEFYGKRLLHLVEWDLATRGPDKLRFPWGPEPGGRLAELNLRGVSVFPTPEGVDPMAHQFQWYCENVQAVGHTAEDLGGPHDLSDVMGNIWEFVDTRPFDYIRGVPTPHLESSFQVGLSAEMTPEEAEWFSLEGRRWDTSYDGKVHTGFRCAKSVDPLDWKR